MTFFKRMMAVAAAAAMTCTTSALSVFAEGEETTEHTVYLCMSAGTEGFWKQTDAGVTAATVTGDGTYTTSIEMQTGSDSIELMLLSTDINLYDYTTEELPDGADIMDYTTVKIAVDSISIDHINSGLTSEIAYTGPSDGAYRTDDEGANARLNILNTWGGNNYTDIDASASYAMDAGDVVTVTFTVSGIDSVTPDPDPDPDPDPVSNTAYLCIQAGGDQAWEADAAGNTPAEIKGNGTYSVSYEVQGGSETVELLLLSTDINAYAYAPDGTAEADVLKDTSVRISIDSISVDSAITGTTSNWNYTGPSDGAFNMNNDGSTLRMNIWNAWMANSAPSVLDLSSTKDTDGDDHFMPDEGLAAGDVITVTFTITGMDKEITSIKGDVDGDGEVTLADATLALTEYAEIAVNNPSTLNETQRIAADVDEDGVVTLADATYILTYYAEAAVNNNPTWEELIG